MPLSRLPRLAFAGRCLRLFLLLSVALTSSRAVGEAMLQYFGTSWAEITAKMPELAEAGYGSLWLPPPTKGSGGLSVGYDLFDPFDLGGRDQRGTVRTRYGTEAELLRLVETAHRFGIRVYFDNIMNHRAFDVPGFNASVPIDVYPGMVPEDFHLRVTAEGFYRKWDNTRSWGDAWQVIHLGLSDLIDIAQEPGPTNLNFGPSEGGTHPKIKFLRHPQFPEFYCYLPNENSGSHADGRGTYVGFGPGNGLTAQFLAEHADYYSEWVEDYLHRAARWKIDRTKADGLRLDAVKHIRADFFGATFGADKDTNDYGYLGQVQRQFNLTRGFSDANHRDSVFETEIPRDDAMAFGEHLGEPPGYGDYVNAGMRLVDNPLRSELNNRLGNPWTGLQGLEQPGSYGFAPAIAVTHAQSHDSDYAARRELQHALYFTRAGIGLIYTDGNYQAETLGESGGAFPRHANTSFLGQWGDNRVPNLLKIHDNFARGYQRGVWSDGDLVAYERIDWREGGSNLGDQVTLLMILNDNYSNGQRPFDRFGFSTSFPPGAYLYQYARGAAAEGDSMQGFYVTTQDAGDGRSFLPDSVVVPRGGYFAFSWKNPDPSLLWSRAGGSPVSITQGGQPVGTVTVQRQDGPDGDPAFNPYGRPDSDPTDYTYEIDLPRVTDGSSLRFWARTDGSAADILLKLNGGIDLNGTRPEGILDPAFRDHPPAVTTDVYLGYERMPDNLRWRQHPELFAASLVERNVTGSGGAETWHFVVGNPTLTRVDGNGERFTDADTAQFIYHDPAGGVGGDAPAGTSTQLLVGESTIAVWAKPNAVGLGYQMFLYYTLDGSNPEGAGGLGTGTTKVAVMNYSHQDDGGSTDWWATTSVPRPADGTEFRYKVGIFKGGSFADGAASAWWPGNADAVYRKQRMMTTVATPTLDAGALVYAPHNDYGATRTGLPEGFHVLRARAFLDRFGRASIYNTFTQPFYYDTQRPSGEIRFPAQNGDGLGGSQYGAVVRSDATVTEVWYRILDAEASNDDVATGQPNGNGLGFEPYVDANRNGQYDLGEPFTDLDGNGVWDADAGPAWQLASEVTPSLNIDSTFEKEWRFNYVNLPAGGAAAQIQVRLREVSSTARGDWSDDLSDEAGHFTTLTRDVNTFGPDTRFFVAFPSQDGDVVGPDYVVKVYFAKILAEGYSSEQLVDQFLARLQSAEDGRIEGGLPLSRSRYAIAYNETEAFHALSVTLPNLYNGIPTWRHGLEIEMNPPGRAPLLTTRLVRAAPVAAAPYLELVSPPEIDLDGSPFELVLPAVASPTPEDRQFLVRVVTASTATAVRVVAGLAPEGDTSTLTLQPGFPLVEGAVRFWEFLWSDLSAGEYRLEAELDTADTTAANRLNRSVTVVFRQRVATNDAKGDDDDDGLPDNLETTPVPLPPGNPEAWTNGQVHAWLFSGRTDPLGPDSDGDRLSDGLELGLQGPVSPTETDLATDTDGDGFPNFLSDVDPPIFNTTDNSSHPRFDLNRSRTDQLSGSLTDPRKPDTDDDGLRDGFEDLNRNGRVDIALLDGTTVTAVLASPPTVYNTSRVDPSALAANAAFLETDPNQADTDQDGQRDGDEDSNGNGRVDLALVAEDGGVTGFDVSLPENAAFLIGGDLPGITSRRLHRAALDAAFPRDGWPRLRFQETDPLNADTDGDGLPDGWEIRHGLDPLDNGTWSLRLAAAGDLQNGPLGDPDGDGFTNLQEFLNGTDPRSADTGEAPPPGSVRLGPVPADEEIRVGTVINRREFTDWSIDDLLVLDEFEGDGFNNQGGDIYPANDGFDSSRDLVAFYARDGGDSAQGGDGRFYFRFDLHDLQPFAEEANLDLYVVIDTGNPASGEYNLPDQIDTGTLMRWEAVVAIYSSSRGAVLVDSNPTVNTTGIGQDLGATGVIRRDESSRDTGGEPNGFIGAYYNSELDSVEVAISRQALRDAGWNGLNPLQLNYQVFATKSGTQNSPRGAGDIGGRSDIRDTFYDDRLAEDHWRDQASLSGNGSVLTSWFSGSGANDRNRRVKVISLLLANHALRPGSEIQQLLNDGLGAGFHRPFDVHEAYDVPVALQITPTLASALQWAAADPARERPWRDGPSFNTRLGELAADGLVDLLGTTFAGHLPGYFSDAFNRDNVDRASALLAGIYGTAPSPRLLVPPERVLDGPTLARLTASPETGGLGFSHLFVDQMRHVVRWFGRTSALGDDGYRLQQVNGAHLFVINDEISTYRFQNTDGGPSLPLRSLLNRKARSGTQDQVVILVSDLGDFATQAQADAYDRNVRWMASRPWISFVTPSAILDGAVPYRDGGNQRSDWRAIDRGTDRALPASAKDFVDFATLSQPDKWYFGSSEREGLAPVQFRVRPDGPLTESFGQVGANGLANTAWQALAAVPADSPLRHLGAVTAHAATFVSAFHQQDPVDLRKFSTGAYLNPAFGYQPLAGFARRAQAQFRFAAVYEAVSNWAAAAAAGSWQDGVYRQAIDVDLDGEPEYLLGNDRVLGLFESLGGRLTGAWVRDVFTGSLHQAVGVFPGTPGSDDETEGETNLDLPGGSVRAFRTSGFKDWYAAGTTSSEYVNTLYTATEAVGDDGSGAVGWTFASVDGRVTKTITLAPRAPTLRAAYALTEGTGPLFVRFGLSPDLEDLLTHGQRFLSAPSLEPDGGVSLLHRRDDRAVRLLVHATGGTWNAAARDDEPGASVTFDTLPMRNQPLTQQVEFSGDDGLVLALTLEAGQGVSLDSTGAGLPDLWKIRYGLDPLDPTGVNGVDGDPDGDGLSNRDEYLLGTHPTLPDRDVFRPATERLPDGSVEIAFTTIPDRLYHLEWSEDLASWQPAAPPLLGTGSALTITDDGTTTGRLPNLDHERFYRVRVSLVE